MDKRELLQKLMALKAPDRILDGEIGPFIGYSKHLKIETDRSTGRTVRSAVWHSPEGDEERLPVFTKLAEDAYLFATTIMPYRDCGASWDEEGGAASVTAGKYFTAPNMAIAICIATVDHLLETEDDEDQDDFVDEQ